jgi:indole-3-glycerol phosphate synthase
MTRPFRFCAKTLSLTKSRSTKQLLSAQMLVLLIAAALDDRALAELRAPRRDELGLGRRDRSAHLEELRRAVSTGARLIGVNNRDLRTFQTSLETSERLIAEAPRDRTMIPKVDYKTRSLCAISGRSASAGFSLAKR